MFIASIYWLSHEEFLELLRIQVDESHLRHKHDALLLNILGILRIDVISNYQKGAILEIAKAIIKDRLCCITEYVIHIFAEKV